MKPSGSKLAVLPYCGYFARPDVAWPADEAGDAAAFGNAIHALCESAIRSRALTVEDAAKAHGVAESGLPRLRRVWAVALDYIATRARVGWCAEVPLAWSWRMDTARELPSKGHRDYSDAYEDEVCGTADVATMDDGVAVVMDWKTGRSDLDSYREQASFLALAWARSVGASQARAVFVRFSEDGFEERVWVLGSMDLDATAMLLEGRLAEADERRAEPVPGPHCTELYCPARTTCPATASIIRSNPDVAPLAELVASAITTPADAGRAYVQLRLVKDAVKVVEERIREVVEAQGSAPTSPGKVIKLTTTTRETFSQGRIPPERRDAVLADLRELGALTSSTSTYLRECKG